MKASLWSAVPYLPAWWSHFITPHSEVLLQTFPTTFLPWSSNPTSYACQEPVSQITSQPVPGYNCRRESVTTMAGASSGTSKNYIFAKGFPLGSFLYLAVQASRPPYERRYKMRLLTELLLIKNRCCVGYASDLKNINFYGQCRGCVPDASVSIIWLNTAMQVCFLVLLNSVFLFA